MKVGHSCSRNQLGNQALGEFLYRAVSDACELSCWASCGACRKLPGVGKVTEKQLETLAIRTVQDALAHMHDIYNAFPPKTATSLHRRCVGVCGDGDAWGMGSADPDDEVNAAPAALGRKSIGYADTQRTSSASILEPTSIFVTYHAPRRRFHPTPRFPPICRPECQAALIVVCS